MTVPQANKDVMVGIGDLKVVKDPDAILSTHGLGSCVGLCIYDPAAKVGGILHYLLPTPTDPTAPVAPEDMAKYGSTGIPLLFRKAYELGAVKERLIVCAAGAGEFLSDSAGFNVGKRNHNLLRKVLFKNMVRLDAKSLGGSTARTLWLHLNDGSLIVTNKGDREPLWKPSTF